jgi:hypothetical protein
LNLKSEKLVSSLCFQIQLVPLHFGPLAVRADGKGWGHPDVVKTVAVIGLCFNVYFCLPAFAGEMNGFWGTPLGYWSLLGSYMLSTPVEPFVQLHLLSGAVHKLNAVETIA